MEKQAMRFRGIASLSFFLFTLSAGTYWGQQDKDAKPPAITDPQQAGIDFRIQGEYEGELTGQGKWGAQVFTVADGKFRVMFMSGGLPGAGWDGKAKTVQGEALRAESKAVIAGPWRGEIDPEAQSLTGKTDKGLDFTLRKVARQSPTMHAKPPDGALVLFDGTSAEHFPKAKMSDDKLLLVPAISKQRWKSVQLHVEFIVPYRCPSRGNSGVILQNCYEIQVLESFGAPPSPSGCGGLYVFRKPDVNMTFPPLSWQTYDVDFTAARFDTEGKMIERPVITVRHNGVLIHDRVTLPEKGNIGKPTPDGGPLHLQAHGSPVRYRNIWIVEKE
jgi:hypothetical protein